IMDFPPAPSAPAAASRASWSIWTLQGVTWLQVEAIPTTGFLKSSSLKPTARNIDRLGARSGPSSTIEEYWRSEGLELLMENRSPRDQTPGHQARKRSQERGAGSQERQPEEEGGGSEEVHRGVIKT